MMNDFATYFINNFGSALCTVAPSALIGVAQVVIIHEAFFRTNRTLNLIKNYRKNWMITPNTFPERKSISELQEQVNFNDVKDLMPYLEKLENYTSIHNMKSVYHNLGNVIRKKMVASDLSGVVGSYNVRNNRIKYMKSSDLGHEFLHLASSAYDEKNGIEYCGFSQKHKLRSICDGLNEGYTELLASRLYNKNNKPEAYKSFVSIASLFEYFFDDPKEMEKYYFNHDLPGFIKHMEQFAPRKEIIEILVLLDSLLIRHKLSFAILPTFDEVQIKMKLYRMLKSKCQDPYKLAAFEKQLETSYFIKMVRSGQKFKLIRKNPYVSEDKANTKKL